MQPEVVALRAELVKLGEAPEAQIADINDICRARLTGAVRLRRGIETAHD
jgi:hypothetical protein